MLPESAKAVIGQPHPTGRAAMRMLEREGFHWDSYVDIFDGGPTVIAQTDKIKSVRDSNWYRLAGTHKGNGEDTLMVATGRLEEFKCCYARGEIDGDEIRIDAKAIARRVRRLLVGKELGGRQHLEDAHPVNAHPVHVAAFLSQCG